ncbi:hypothetical protein BC832DRAFT_537999 [Gaertneriomyces semiglobifer]|nr:hypothetical protein BC832DRAFT_537999 [Gaertneriomyces semiglobifer]
MSAPSLAAEETPSSVRQSKVAIAEAHSKSSLKHASNASLKKDTKRTPASGHRVKRLTLAVPSESLKRRMTVFQQQRLSIMQTSGSEGAQGSEDDPNEGPENVTKPTRYAPVTRDDIELCFTVAGRDGKKIARADIVTLLDTIQSSVAYTPYAGMVSPARDASTANLLAGGSQDKNKEKALTLSKGVKDATAKFLLNGKEEMTKDGLSNLLLNRAVRVAGAEEGFSLFDPALSEGLAHPVLGFQELKRIAASMSPYGLPHKGDVEALLKAFDCDGDGAIGVDDFKRMTV